MVGYRGSTPRGTGGAGIAGAISGLQQAQQFNLNADSNDRAEKQEGRAEKLFDRQLHKMKGQEFFELMDSAEQSNNYTGVNKFLGGAGNEAFGGGNIMPLGVKTAIGRNGQPDNAMLNQYRSDTGSDYVEGQDLMQYTDGEGKSRYFTPDTFANGSGYGAYRRDKQSARDLVQAKTDKANAVKAPNFDAALEKSNSIKEIATVRNSDEYKTLNEEIDSGGGFDGDYFGKLVELETLSGNTFKNPELQKGITAYGDMKQVQSDISQLNENGGTNMGISKGMASDVARIGNNEDLKPEEKMKQFNTVVANSKMGGMIARYLKAMSGSSVTAEEFAMTLYNTAGGDMSKINMETLQAAMAATTDSMNSTLGSQVDDIMPGTPASKAWQRGRLYRANHPTASNPEMPNTPSSGKNLGIEKVGLNAVADEAEALINFGGQGMKTLWERIANGTATNEEKEQAKNESWYNRAISKGKEKLDGFVNGTPAEPKATTTPTTPTEPNATTTDWKSLGKGYSNLGKFKDAISEITSIDELSSMVASGELDTKQHNAALNRKIALMRGGK